LTIIDLDGLALNVRITPMTRHETLIRLAVSVMRLPQISVRYYLRAFEAYIQHLSLPEVENRVLRHQLWKKLSRQALALRAAKNQA
jgi:hypothetical protein